MLDSGLFERCVKILYSIFLYTVNIFNFLFFSNLLNTVNYLYVFAKPHIFRWSLKLCYCVLIDRSKMLLYYYQLLDLILLERQTNCYIYNLKWRVRRPGFEPGLPDWQSDVLDQTGRPSHQYSIKIQEVF